MDALRALTCGSSEHLHQASRAMNTAFLTATGTKERRDGDRHGQGMVLSQFLAITSRRTSDLQTEVPSFKNSFERGKSLSALVAQPDRAQNS